MITEKNWEVVIHTPHLVITNCFLFCFVGSLFAFVLFFCINGSETGSVLAQRIIKSR